VTAPSVITLNATPPQPPYAFYLHPRSRITLLELGLWLMSLLNGLPARVRQPGNEVAITTARETRIKIKSLDLSRKDWELCCSYVQEMKGGAFPHTKLGSSNSRRRQQIQIENQGVLRIPVP
jgi:hypothetical protein